jgi:hypothetical protein
MSLATPPPDPARSPEAHSAEVIGVLAAIDSLSTTLAVARALVSAGRVVDLDGLEQEAARLCLALGCMAEGAAPLLRPPLHELARELDRLELALRLPG